MSDALARARRLEERVADLNDVDLFLEKYGR
jgi:hypothetical protein